MIKSETTTAPNHTELGAEQAREVGGGDLCSAQELVELTKALTTAYENLVEFTSHVIERVAG